MKQREYEAALKVAQRELVDLTNKREALDRHIAQTRQTVLILQQKVYTSPEGIVGATTPTNLTEACYWALVASKVPLNAPTIRDRVIAYGFKITSSNPLASVHSILKRMTERGDVFIVLRRNADGSFQLMPRCFWWGQYELPKGWALEDTKAVEKQWKEGFKRIDAKYESEIKRKRRKLERASKGGK